jgi:hypothetical protein
MADCDSSADSGEAAAMVETAAACRVRRRVMLLNIG